MYFIYGNPEYTDITQCSSFSVLYHSKNERLKNERRKTRGTKKERQKNERQKNKRWIMRDEKRETKNKRKKIFKLG